MTDDPGEGGGGGGGMEVDMWDITLICGVLYWIGELSLNYAKTTGRIMWKAVT